MDRSEGRIKQSFRERVLTMNRFAKLVILVLLCSGLTATPLRGDSAELKSRLAQIDGQRDGLSTPSEKLENECLALLTEDSTPKEKGMIYAQIAMIYAQNGMSAPDKTVEYCKKALEFPLDLVKRGDLHIFWADALQIKHRQVPRGQRDAARRELVTVVLRGLDLVLQQNPPPTTLILPVVNKFEAGDAITLEELMEINRKELAAREQVRLKNEMVRCRDILVNKCVTVYAGVRNAENELQELTEDIIADETRIRKIIDLVEQGKKKSEEQRPPQ